jgi:hypothetical protein
VRLLQNVLTELQDESDARREAKRLPYGHGRWQKDQVILSVRGIYRVERNHPLLDDFERALGVAVRLYRKGARRVEATISHRDLIGRLSFTESQARRTIALLASESLVATDESQNESRVILPRIRPFLRVRNVEEYVKCKAKIDRRHRLKRLAESPLAALRWFTESDARNLDKILVGALTVLVGAAFVAAVFWGVGQLSAGSGESGKSGNSPEQQAQRK